MPASCAKVKPKPEFNTIIAGPAPCIDTLGAAKYPKILDVIPLNFVVTSFAKTFGDSFPVTKRELDKGRKHLRVNLIWSDTHTYGDKDIPAIIKEAKRYQILCLANPDAKIELVPFTEHNIQKPDKYLNITQTNAPNCIVVNTPWKGGFTKNARYKNEIHGGGAKPNITGVKYNFSHDGTNSVDENFTATLNKYSDADFFCAWHPRLNGKWSMKDTTPRSERNAWPSKDMMRSLVYLFSEKGETSIPAKWTIKSHAERHDATDTKGDKLLIISPIKTDKITLKRAGKKIATLPYYGPFTAGGYRYYSSFMGYKLGADLDVYTGSKKRGTINGGFRLGNYR